MRFVILAIVGLFVAALYGSRTEPAPIVPPTLAAIEQPKPAETAKPETTKLDLSKAQIVQLYADHEEDIRAIWVELGDDATMGDAVHEWLKRNPETPIPAVGQPKPAESDTSKAAPVGPETQMVAYEPAKAACCDGDCCQCTSKKPYWLNPQTGKLVEGYFLTPEDAAAINKQHATLRSAQPAASSTSRPCFGCGYQLLPSDRNCRNCGMASPYYKADPPPCVIPPRPRSAQQPVTTFYYSAPMQSGGCANGQCGTGGGGFFGRRR